ncbi:permease-like cell division protein FtsX [Conexibacter sp. JD483]|uniref:permease-like cell division protein FtsX n=1 Tax=unclassified Conexibacter TaxID=2627773 RepID=UPI00271E40AA|nr:MULTISPECIES: permease-like cell division protein FtsX [unclassified Conexibacter]MDO8186692.1 permease-like cell division protein FtsX [Conexibacter sp. CPCC 205706]MDO8200412.1 permease-like cell division protein FtsX [Conexibacter sp. CPCC 205762]MDR9371076.1 permease-like cell division protein FtsX [Conexibacter sp. JD483]
MKIGFFAREAMRSLGRNAAPSFAALATILLTMLVIGVFIPIVQATTGAANDVRQRVLVDVYLRRNATARDAERVRAMLLDTPNVKRVEFISKQQAYEQQRKKDPEAFDLLGANPLPDTFRVTPENPDTVLEIKSDLAPAAAGGGRTPVDQSIDEVRDRREDTTKILQVTRFVKLMAGTLGALLIAASIFLIANTIRLSLYARRREVEVMKLVGATDWFIRWPFVIEGVIVGALGTLLAILLLAVGKIAIIDPLADDFALIAAPETLPFAALVAVMLGAGIAISAIGSAVSLRRFLRV